MQSMDKVSAYGMQVHSVSVRYIPIEPPVRRRDCEVDVSVAVVSTIRSGGIDLNRAECTERENGDHDGAI